MKNLGKLITTPTWVQQLRIRRSNCLVSGQSTVEFALTLMLLLVIIVGIIEMGRLILTYTSIAAAGREAARYAAGVSNVNTSLKQYNDCTGIRNAAKRVGWFADLQDTDITLSFDSGPLTTATAYCNPSATLNPNRYTRIRVRILISYSFLTGVLQLPSFPLESNSARSILYQASISR